MVLGNIHQLYTSGFRGQETLGVLLNHVGRLGVFNDEAHNTVAHKYDELLDLLSKSGKTVLRVDTTATPDRADKESVNSRHAEFTQLELAQAGDDELLHDLGVPGLGRLRQIRRGDLEQLCGRQVDDLRIAG